jgi:tRNA threonylcarbamoyladenosine biosynthesis protein TsaE
MHAPERPANSKTGTGHGEFKVAEQITKSHEETVGLARRFAKSLAPGHWVGLIGPLGAGKSVFARAVGEEWGVRCAMPSPSYTLMNTYEGRCTIYHIDLYRVGSPDELDFAGLTQYFSGPGICLVEWPDKARSMWPDDGWLIVFVVEGPTTRRISIERFARKSKMSP